MCDTEEVTDARQQEPRLGARPLSDRSRACRRDRRPAGAFLRTTHPGRGRGFAEVLPGNLFVALAGERTDGHQFPGAVRAGAAALLIAETLRQVWRPWTPRRPALT
jgi:hypothetical protein